MKRCTGFFVRAAIWQGKDVISDLTCQPCMKDKVRQERERKSIFHQVLSLDSLH